MNRRRACGNRALIKPLLMVAAVMTLAGPAPVRAATVAAADTVLVTTIGPRYRAGWLKRLVFGSGYRSLWTAPVAVPVLDVNHYAGGLTAVSRGGGYQTTSLRFRAADGREFYFRSLDKDPTRKLPTPFQGTVVADIVRDQVSSSMPVGALVVAPLLDAAGVLNGRPQLLALPDDPRLGEWREATAGLVGLMEPIVASGWGGSSEVIDGAELIARVERSPDDRVDAMALLKARLIDVLVGDWDRHRDQWSWARFGDGTPHIWQPVPRDRDYAFVRYDGLALRMARQRIPKLIKFGRKYPDVVGLTWNGRELDRRFLTIVPWEDWLATVGDLQSVLTDEVIADAVATLPPAYRRLAGDELCRALRERRDDLPDIARRFFLMLNAQADVFATGSDDLVEVRPAGDRGLEVVATRKGATAGAMPYLSRRFTADETREIRLYLDEGDDLVRAVGDRRAPIGVRIIGGVGSDTLRVDGGGALHFYDDDAGTVAEASDRSAVLVDRRPFELPPKRDPGEIPPRDWGVHERDDLVFSSGPDLGILIGMGHTWTRYGFRHLPFAARHRLSAGYATEAGSFRAEYSGQFRRENETPWWEARVRASGIEVFHFHGFGNEAARAGDPAYFRGTRNEYAAALAIVHPVGDGSDFRFGIEARRQVTDERPDRYLNTVRPYGDGSFGEIVLWTGFALSSNWPQALAGQGHGSQARLDGRVSPPWWDVTTAYGSVRGEVETATNAAWPLRPLLRLAAGGQRVWGTYPYTGAAYLGGAGTARLGSVNRYAGDAALWARSELRLKLVRVSLGAPMDVGAMGLADVGRVFLKNEDSRRWHGVVGGGIWLSVLDGLGDLSLAVTDDGERYGYYFAAAFAY
jgi:hypothetical protein